MKYKKVPRGILIKGYNNNEIDKELLIGVIT